MGFLGWNSPNDPQIFSTLAVSNILGAKIIGAQSRPYETKKTTKVILILAFLLVKIVTEIIELILDDEYMISVIDCRTNVCYCCVMLHLL